MSRRHNWCLRGSHVRTHDGVTDTRCVAFVAKAQMLPALLLKLLLLLQLLRLLVLRNACTALART